MPPTPQRQHLIRKPEPAVLAEASNILRRGGLVAFPTETVYGLGADASNPDALRHLYAVKGRPVDHPVIVHIGSIQQLGQWAKEVPEAAQKLAEAFWPGPLTLILPRTDQVPDTVTGGQDTVGIRIPNHPTALALLQVFGGGIAAPSANRFGRLSPTTAQHVLNDLGGDADLILDDGACSVGVESTIVAFPDGKPTILRPGMITEAQVKAVLAGLLQETHSGLSIPRVSGSLASHYAPRTPVCLVDSDALLREVQKGGTQNTAVLARSPIPPELSGTADLHWLVAPSKAAGYAQNLYANLRRLDELNATRIYVEAVPQDGEWAAIYDRLQRASHRG
jgi:L-threonylcarbamoyladenylate synthase